ncbi:Germin-like protein subfamily 1 member 7 [Morella rubra]|uniref:Germin-like protein n=1 Tax=Morella rubra TaxID=262757 RepID=A0A6A1V3H7_9ROSI|nr:Germin-like protein subfamily 1 member 7 [Morella rubra]
MFVNGKLCEQPKFITANDFFLSRLQIFRNTANQLGSNVTAVNVDKLPGLNTLDNRLFTKVLNKGGVFVFPVGLIHFQLNVGKTNATAFASLNSQNSRVITIANAVFGSNLSINPDVLTKTFQMNKNMVDYLQKQFWSDNNN